jgi:hypothetical protein
MALSPIVNLPVRWQVLGVDVESLAPWKGFTDDSFDVASVNGTLMVENPVDQKVDLVLPFPTERSTAEIRVLSTNKREGFVKPDVSARQFVDFLKHIGEISPDQEPMLRELRELTKDFRVAELEIPAGQQILRFHARQILEPDPQDPRAFEVTFFAPLAGFILAPSGQTQMSVTVVFPPPFAAPGMQIEQPQIEPLPGIPDPQLVWSGVSPIASRPVYGWLWRNDPKVTIPYRYP